MTTMMMKMMMIMMMMMWSGFWLSWEFRVVTSLWVSLS